jgi:hypothetical protein
MSQKTLLPRGFVLVAAAKKHYFDRAVEAARSIKKHHPDIPVDLYSDREFHDESLSGTFVIPFEKGAAKPAVLQRSRFERMIYLDSDVLLTAPINDVFDVLERFDIALAQDQFPTNKYCMIQYCETLPACFPHFNGGVMALRRNPATSAFLENWLAAIRDHAIGRDQPSLRYILWKSDLRIATLPPEYNMMNLDLMLSKPMDHCHMAPRVIHNPHFYQFHGLFQSRADPVADSFGLRRTIRLRNLLKNDPTLWPSHPPPRRAGFARRLSYQVSGVLNILPRVPSQINFDLQYLYLRLKKRLGR